MLFDAGNTLLDLDCAFLADLCGKLGLAVRPAEVGAAAAGHLRRHSNLYGSPPAAGDPSDLLLGSFRAIGEALGLGAAARRGPGLAVVSNSDGQAQRHLELAGLRHFFAVVIDSAEGGLRKPEPGLFHLAWPPCTSRRRMRCTSEICPTSTWRVPGRLACPPCSTILGTPASTPPRRACARWPGSRVFSDKRDPALPGSNRTCAQAGKPLAAASPAPIWRRAAARALRSIYNGPWSSESAAPKAACSSLRP